MALRDYLHILIKYLRLMLLGGGLGLLLGLGGSWWLDLLPAYSATATISLGGNVAQAERDRTYMTLNDEFLSTYADLATRDPILQAVITQLGLPLASEDLADLIAAEVVEDTQFIEITARAQTPRLAAAIANAVAQQLIAAASLRVRDFVTLAEEAPVPTDPDKLWLVITLTGAVLGLVLAGGTGFLIEFIRDPVYSAAELSRRTGLTPLVTIRPTPDWRRRFSRQTPLWRKVRDTAWWPLTQVSRRCFEALELPANPHPKTPRILVTSPTPGREKAIVALNLAAAWAQSGAQVLLVEADCHSPLLDEWLDLAGQPGLADLLARPGQTPDTRLEGLLHPTPTPGLTVLLAGKTRSATTDPLPLPAFNQLLAELEARADVVILNGPPLLTSAAGAMIAGQVHGVFLTLAIGKTRLTAAADARDTLAMTHSHLWGTILIEGIN